MFVRLLFLSILFSLVVLPAYSAELVTPGAGLTLSPADLAVQSASAGLDVIQASEDGYRIHGNITIASGDRLVIAPGTRFLVEYPFENERMAGRILAEGIVEAVGTPSDPVIFEVSPPYQQSFQWMGFYEDNQAGVSRYEHCLFRWGGSAFICRNSSPIIQNCTFEQQALWAAAAFSGSQPRFADNLVQGASHSVGLRIVRGNSACGIENNRFESSDTALLLEKPQGAVLRNNWIEGARATGVMFSGPGQAVLEDFTVRNCYEGILACASAELELSGGSITGCICNGLYLMDGAEADVRNCLIAGNAQGDADWSDVPFGGIQVIGGAALNLGDEDRPGMNTILGNEGGNLLNLTANAISALGNRWDSPLIDLIVSRIWDEAAAIANESDFVPGPVLVDPVWIPTDDLLRFGAVWQSTDEAWDAVPGEGIDENDLLWLLEQVR